MTATVVLGTSVFTSNVTTLRSRVIDIVIDVPQMIPVCSQISIGCTLATLPLV
jgi:hypothetical protein